MIRALYLIILLLLAFLTSADAQRPYTLALKPDGTIASPTGSLLLSDPAFGGTLPIARLNVGTASDAVAAGDDSRFVCTTPEMYGALGNGVADDTAAIQTALTAAGNAGGGTVQLRAVTYLVAGSLTVPPFVYLRGAQDGVIHRTIAEIGQPLDELSGHGTLLLITGGSGLATEVGTINLDRSAGCGGFSMYWPNQTGSSATPTAYPWAVKTAQYGCTIERINLINPHRGIDCGGGRANIRDITGDPLYLGIRVQNAGDVVRIRDVHWVLSWRNGKTVDPWVRENSIGLWMVGGAEFMVEGFFAFYMGEGIRHAGGYGAYRGCGLDVCRIGMRVVGGDSQGTSISDSGFCARGACIQVEDTFAGTLLVRDAHLWNGTEDGATLVTIAGGAVSLQGSTFQNGGPQRAVSIESGADVSILGNQIALKKTGGGSAIACLDDTVTGMIRDNSAEGEICIPELNGSQVSIADGPLKFWSYVCNGSENSLTVPIPPNVFRYLRLVGDVACSHTGLADLVARPNSDATACTRNLTNTLSGVTTGALVASAGWEIGSVNGTDAGGRFAHCEAVISLENLTCLSSGNFYYSGAHGQFGTNCSVYPGSGPINTLLLVTNYTFAAGSKISVYGY